MQLLLITLLALNQSFAQDQAALNPSQLRLQGSYACESSGQYIHNELKQLKFQKSLSAGILKSSPVKKNYIQRACIKSAQDQVSAGHFESNSRGQKKFIQANNFVRCKGSNRNLEQNLMTPCSSTESVAYVHNAFELVTQCLAGYVADSSDPVSQRDWIRTYFKMLTKESGFHNYVKSNSNAYGIGQVTAPYLADFKEKTLESARAYLKLSNISECNRLGEQILTDSKLNSIGRCSLVGLNEDQVLTNLAIGFSNLRIYRERARLFLERNSQNVKMSESQVRNAEHFLVPWGYNGGSGNLEKWINAGLKNRNRKPVQTSNELYAALVPKIDKEEARLYLPRIQERYQKVVEGSGYTNCWAQ